MWSLPFQSFIKVTGITCEVYFSSDGKLNLQKSLKTMSGLRRQEIQALYICIIFLITLRGVISKHHHGHQSNEEETVGETVKFSPEFKYSCVYENVTYQGGHKFRPDPCTYCRCPRLGGRPRCAIQDCYQEPSCVEYHKVHNSPSLQIYPNFIKCDIIPNNKTCFLYSHSTTGI